MILVTGGTGLVGAHLLFFLTERDEKIRAIYRTEESIKKTKKIFGFYTERVQEKIDSIEWIKADITDIIALTEVFKDIKTVYHCAAMVSFVKRDKEKLYNNNVIGTTNIVNLCLENKVKMLCHVSSVASLQKTNNTETVTESTEFDLDRKHSGYALSKHYSEVEVWRGIAEGLNAVIINPSVILGPGEWNSGAGEIFSKIDKGMKFYTEGVTGFVDVKDVCKIMIMLVDKNITNNRFIVNRDNYSYKHIFYEIARQLEKTPPTIKANLVIASVAWRMELLRSFITGKRPVITKDSIKSAFSTTRYSNKKIQEELKIDFIPVEQSIKFIVSCYKKTRG
ncbi:MAG: NAD-dependent epimerase/dehydratase family protein [Chlorobi bacterium]|nr:NAD-dependent epimerase/dehydratase family protein [Chlorobiota bacterium]